MALKTTPTIAICLAAGLAAGIALARPGDEPATIAASPGESVAVAEPVSDDPYAGLADAAEATQAEPESEVGTSAAVTIEGFDFSGAATVAPGGVIEVTNLDSAPHTLTADDGSFDTGNLGQNEVGAITAPTAPGTYTFFCAIHPSMTGSITVG